MAKNNLLSEQLKYTGVSQTPTHVHLCTYSATGVEHFNAKNFAEIEEHLSAESINWLQVHGLEDTEAISHICQHFQIDFLTTQDILNANHLTKIEEHDDYNVVILKLLSRLQDRDDFQTQQLCIIQGNNYVISFTESETDFFNEVGQAIENNVLKIRTRSSDFLLSVLLNSVMASFMSIIAGIEDALEDIEEALLSDNDRNEIGIENIQSYRRQYSMVKKAIYPLKEQYAKLFRTENNLLHKVNRPFFNDVNDHLQFIIQTLDGCRETFASLFDLYVSNNDLRMNNIMKQLTVVSTIFIPLTFLAGVWGMNFKWMPELDWQYGYLYAWSMMFMAAIIVYLYFKRKKWY